MSADTIDKVLVDIAMTCALACVTGQPTVTLACKGKRPPGFPRGELLSVGTDGSHNIAVDPLKALAWVRRMAGARLSTVKKP